MSKRNKNHNNEFLQLNDKKSSNSAYNVYLLDKNKTKKFYSNAKRSPLGPVETASLPITVLSFCG